MRRKCIDIWKHRFINALMGLKRRERQSNESFKILNGLVIKKKRLIERYRSMHGTVLTSIFY